MDYSIILSVLKRQSRTMHVTCEPKHACHSISGHRSVLEEKGRERIDGQTKAMEMNGEEKNRLTIHFSWIGSALANNSDIPHREGLTVNTILL